MKKLKKVFATVLAVGLSASSVAMAGCKNKVANDDQTLEIFIENFGYGVEWLDAEIALFKQQDWVKEKYPNLNIPKPAYNTESGWAANRIMSKDANTTDLFFSVAPASGYYNKVDNSGTPYFEDLTSLYESTVPEEEVTLKDKMLDDLVEMQHIEKFDGGKTYYAVPWVDGWMGILYNKTLVDEYLGADYQLPRTTNEFLQMTTDIKAAKIPSYNGKTATPFISSSKVSYWTEILVTWWAQYEGEQGYENFWNGVDNFGNRSSSIFSQKGRLRALEALESLIGVDAGNNHAEVNTLEFTYAQAKFLLGEGIMMPNGDWFQNEMSGSSANNRYELTFMKTPVISSIIEKCQSVKDDATLAKVVTAIDEGKSYEETAAIVAGLQKADYNKIYEARKIIYKIKGHEAFIPSYATAKGLAKDFLLFLATDKACEKFIESSNGCGVPYKYDIMNENVDLYNSLPTMHKDRISIMNDAIKLMPLNSFRLVNYGGLSYFVKTSMLDVAFTAKNKDDRKTAAQIWQEDIDFYTNSNEANWKSLLINAGL